MTSYLVPCALYNLRSSSPLPSPCTALKREYRPRRKKQRVERHRLRSKALRSNAYGFLPNASFQLHSPHRTAPACVQKEEDSRQSRQGVTCCFLSCVVSHGPNDPDSPVFVSGGGHGCCDRIAVDMRSGFWSELEDM